MKNNYFQKISVLVFTLVFLAGCTDSQEDKLSQSKNEGETRPVVYVSNYPLQYFVKRLAPWTDVRFPAAESADPAFWKPTPEDVSAMQQADLIVLNGASYESWLKNVTLPPSKLLNTAAGFKDRLIPLADKTTHSHGLEGEHEHSAMAFTTWLDIKLAVEQAQSITTALAARWPEHSSEVKTVFTALKNDLQLLDEQMQNTVRTAQDRPVIFSHPIYQYLQKRYGINGKSVQWEPDVMPDEGMWQELNQLIRDHPAKWIIWEGVPLPRIVARLESLGIRSVVFDPCVGTPSQEDFLSTMKINLVALKIAFGDS
ncbi:zinc ABC transporter substrate-binding protein [candidate division KSB1 bacterium]|nr:zinc ABC transporter substrate-binding protein [candidate division KSB1 bacterium]